MSDEIIRQEYRGDSDPSPVEGGIKFTGKAPPQFFEAMKAIKQEKQADSAEARLASSKDPFEDLGPVEPVTPQPKARMHGKVRTMGSPEFEEVVARLREQSFVYDEIMLPSRGVCYNGGDGPQDGVLHVRAMTGEEEQILATPRYVKRGTAINMIFQRCVRETIKADDLLSVDRTYLLIALRSISYGHNYEVEIRCPDCNHKFPYTIPLNQLMVDYCPADFDPAMQDKLPKSGLSFSWSLPRGKDENLVTEYRDKRVKEYGDAATDDSLLYRIALMLINIEGVTDKTELMILLKKLPIQDVSYLRSIANDPPFGVDTKCDISCPNCFHDFEVELPLEAGFFFPRHKKKKMEEENSSNT